MTVRVVGLWCIECLQRPALAGGLCSACDRTARAFGRSVPMSIVSVHDPRFEAELRAWREGRL